MRCPECRENELHHQLREGITSDGEPFSEEVWRCNQCGDFSEGDLDKVVFDVPSE